MNGTDMLLLTLYQLVHLKMINFIDSLVNLMNI